MLEIEVNGIIKILAIIDGYILGLLNRQLEINFDKRSSEIIKNMEIAIVMIKAFFRMCIFFSGFLEIKDPIAFCKDNDERVNNICRLLKFT